jgi:hypothetical protein
MLEPQTKEEGDESRIEPEPSEGDCEGLIAPSFV